MAPPLRRLGSPRSGRPAAIHLAMSGAASRTSGEPPTARPLRRGHPPSLQPPPPEGTPERPADATGTRTDSRATRLPAAILEAPGGLHGVVERRPLLEAVPVPCDPLTADLGPTPFPWYTRRVGQRRTGHSQERGTRCRNKRTTSRRTRTARQPRRSSREGSASSLTIGTAAGRGRGPAPTGYTTGGAGSPSPRTPGPRARSIPWRRPCSHRASSTSPRRRP